MRGLLLRWRLLFRPECNFEIYFAAVFLFEHERKIFIHFSFCQRFGEVDSGFSDEIRLSRVVCVAGEMHDSFQRFLRFRAVFRRGRRCVAVTFPSCLSQFLFSCRVYRKSKFVVPFRMLASTLDGLGASRLVVELKYAIRILLADVPLIRQIFCLQDNHDESADLPARHIGGSG